ncbi:hypothetical protein PICSAR240_02275 [Mycobacterium avium subsp. paratuberculosis]|nr:hypothetical protein B0172_01026 [Mycobacterium avium subsp. paratuberculosis]OVF02798.1 hypothetical protein B0173_03253 [Mycobacterium avium subsp. paratuberculosis]QKU45214.1 hypothetical protein MAP44135_1809 [Mycobacterium avium subsp. paratuberculosis]CAG6883586.1 hypothetical protein PICSAR119_01796 [Mycobacterium avium subsp. paratuberculosis]CAG6884772.1 hypothetical protein PICSAR104_01806 [Mycobacterium avium subsp. paratuberculosis]
MSSRTMSPSGSRPTRRVRLARGTVVILSIISRLVSAKPVVSDG